MHGAISWRDQKVLCFEGVLNISEEEDNSNRRLKADAKGKQLYLETEIILTTS